MTCGGGQRQTLCKIDPKRVTPIVERYSERPSLPHWRNKPQPELLHRVRMYDIDWPRLSPPNFNRRRNRASLKSQSTAAAVVRGPFFKKSCYKISIRRISLCTWYTFKLDGIRGRLGEISFKKCGRNTLRGNSPWNQNSLEVCGSITWIPLSSGPYPWIAFSAQSARNYASLPSNPSLLENSQTSSLDHPAPGINVRPTHRGGFTSTKVQR